MLWLHNPSMHRTLLRGLVAWRLVFKLRQGVRRDPDTDIDIGSTYPVRLQGDAV
jgi:hypothetical protein